MSLAQGNNTPTRPRIEPGSPDPESDALTTRPVRPPLTVCNHKINRISGGFVALYLRKNFLYCELSRLTHAVLRQSAEVNSRRAQLHLPENIMR